MDRPVDDWIAHHAYATPNKLAQIDLASGRRRTYTEMNERVARVAGHLKSLGVKPGDRVGFLAMNSIDIMDIAFGCWRVGAICLALNFRLTAPELEYIINDAGPDVVFIDQDFAELGAALRPTTKVAHWIMMDGLGGADTPYEQAVAAATPVYERTPQSLSDQCMLMYSSGTTGRPKGVIITHEMMFYSAVNASPHLSAHTVNLIVMPLFHIGGFNVFACPTHYCGGTVVIARAFDPGATLDAFNDAELGVSHFLGVPAIFNAMAMHPKAETTDFSRLEVVLCGAEAVPEALVLAWNERGVKVQEGFGMTESVASNCILPKEDVPGMVGSAGKGLMHGEMKIVREDGTDAAPNETGEIWMRGPAITPGYWNRPDANEECFVDGWFRSGDVGRIDADGYVYIEDRIKDMYISGGENVYPAEIENTLYEIPQIREVAVIGVSDPQWGETGCAVVAIKEGESLTPADIIGHCAHKLAKFKHPRHVVFVDALPRNATGKVQKFKLRDTVPQQLTDAPARG